jgi:hypothetical protein
MSLEDERAMYATAPESAPAKGMESSLPTDASEPSPELDELREERDRRQARASSAYNKAMLLRQEEQIIDPDPESASAVVSLGNRGTHFNLEQLERQKTLVHQLAAKKARLQVMGPEQMLDVLRLLEIEDGTSAKTVQSLQEARKKAAGLRAAGAHPNDQRLKLLQTEIGVHESLLSAQLESIRRAQSTKLAIEKVSLESAQKRYENPPDERKKILEYVEAKAIYLSEKAMLTKAEERYRIAEWKNFPAERIRNWRRLPTSSR